MDNLVKRRQVKYELSARGNVFVDGSSSLEDLLAYKDLTIEDWEKTPLEDKRNLLLAELIGIAEQVEIHIEY